jgi:hypothetical protein
MLYLVTVIWNRALHAAAVLVLLVLRPFWSSKYLQHKLIVGEADLRQKLELEFIVC